MVQTGALPASRAQPTAGLVIIGNEVLSAKVQDLNTPQLLERLSAAGVRVGEVAIIADDEPRIAAVVQGFSTRFDLVVTTGGVGPTHDDCTWRSVGAAFGLPLAEHPEVLARLEARLGRDLSTEQRRLALLPVGTRLEGGTSRWPLLVLRNVYVLPGVPSLVASSLEHLCARWAAQRPQLATIYLNVDEFFVIPHIDATVAEFAELEIGSYPIFDPGDHRLRLTLEGWDYHEVERAVAAVVRRIGPEHLVRAERRFEHPPAAESPVLSGAT